MSITEAERFADRVETDDAFVATLAATLAATTDPAAAYQVVLDNGYDVQPEEIRDVLLERHGDELTPEQLDAINGGLEDFQLIGVVVLANSSLIVIGALAGAT